MIGRGASCRTGVFPQTGSATALRPHHYPCGTVILNLFQDPTLTTRQASVMGGRADWVQA